MKGGPSSTGRRVRLAATAGGLPGQQRLCRAAVSVTISPASIGPPHQLGAMASSEVTVEVVIPFATAPLPPAQRRSRRAYHLRRVGHDLELECFPARRAFAPPHPAVAPETPRSISSKIIVSPLASFVRQTFRASKNSAKLATRGDLVQRPRRRAGVRRHRGRHSTDWSGLWILAMSVARKRAPS